MSASRRLQIVLPALAAALSAAYLHLILRDGPRIIDATAYYLEAKVLASGALTLPVSGPPHATVGRFLVAAAGSRDAASVIFPPGYPALLALGFLVGAPLAVGPALAAVICGLTMDVTRQMARRLALPRPELVVALAGTLSATCAALRYHTADTMSHGLAAALLLASVACALRLAPRGSAEAAPLPALGLGLTLGALAATRPVTAIAVAIAAAPLLPDLRPRRHLVLAFLGLAPGLLLWLAYQHAATGSLWSTAQGRYYALSDGPPGCFRYGFGAGIGCLGEHGDFVRHNLPDGYGAYQALATTARRLKMHLSDAMGAWPAFPLILLGMGRWWRARPRTERLLAALPLLVVVAYAPFYFDGNYPGGGARLFADALGLEQVFAALAVGALVPARRQALAGAGVVALSFVGLAVYLGDDHRSLRDREGGRPMYQPAVAPADPAALLFVDTDHGFLLARADRPAVARYKGDDHDWLTWDQAGRPPSHRYLRDPRDHLVPLAFPSEPPPELRIEGESLWPPRAQAEGWAWPSHLGGTCASGGKGLVLTPTATEGASMTVDLPPGLAGRHLRARFWSPQTAEATAVLLVAGQPGERHRVPAGECPELDLGPLPAGTLALEVTSRHPLALDAVLAAQNR